MATKLPAGLYADEHTAPDPAIFIRTHASLPGSKISTQHIARNLRNVLHRYGADTDEAREAAVAAYLDELRECFLWHFDHGLGAV